MSNENQNGEDFDLDDAFNEAASALDSNDDRWPKETLENDDEDEGEDKNDPHADEGSVADAQQDAIEDDDFDISTLPPAALKKFKDLEHKASSDSGRVSALQRQLSDQQKQLSTLQSQGRGDSKAAAKIEEKIEELQLDPSLLDDLPELSPLVNALKQSSAEVQRLRSEMQRDVIAPAQQRAAQEREVLELQSLKQIHPDYEEIDGNPAFVQWINSQPEAVKNLAFSDSAADVSAALTYFKQFNSSYKNTPSPQKKFVVNRSVDDLVSFRGDGANRASNPSGNLDAVWDHAANLADKGKL